MNGSNNSKDTSLFVHVGMGFHVSMSIPDAIDFCSKRIQYLESNKLKPRPEQIEEVTSHVQSATMLLLQLQQEMESGGSLNSIAE